MVTLEAEAAVVKCNRSCYISNFFNIFHYFIVFNLFQLWSTLPIGTWNGSLLKEHTDAPRSVYSHDDYVYLVGHGEVTLNRILFFLINKRLFVANIT